MAGVLMRHALFLLATLSAFAAIEWRFDTLSRFFHEKSTALNLAVARVAVAATLLWQVRLQVILGNASLDPVLRVPFLFWGRLAMHWIGPPRVITAVYIIFVVSAFLLLIGLFGRAASAITAISALYLISPLFLYGKVDHVYHHLIIFSLICALFPSTDALSLDALLAARRNRHHGHLRPVKPGAAYGWAMRSMWIFVGLAYYFPGLWKLSRGWVHWLSGKTLLDNIAIAGDRAPWSPVALWLLEHPVLISITSVLVVAFEVGFIFAILFPRARPYAGLVGLAFHLGIYVVLTISFAPLETCYVIFFDWSAILSRLKRAAGVRPSAYPEEARASAEPPPIARALPLAALGLMAIFGVFHVVDTWPLSCYPAFDGPTSDVVTELSLQIPDPGLVARAWSISSDAKLRAEYHNWQQLTTRAMGKSAIARERARAVIAIWMKAHPEVQANHVVVFRDRYRMRPLQGTRILVARNKLWEFAVYPR
jgi:HTTM domain